MVAAVDRFFSQTLAVYTLGYLIAVIASLIAIFVIVRRFVRGYRPYGGVRVVICPETHERATVKIDALPAAESCPFRKADVRLASCSRWPERADCTRLCIEQIEVPTRTHRGRPERSRLEAGVHN
jgi:hypothetical protein